MFLFQEQLKYLSVDLENATNQLQTVQNTLQVNEYELLKGEV